MKPLSHLVRLGSLLAGLELLEVPVADLHVAVVVVHALCETGGGAGAVVLLGLLRNRSFSVLNRPPPNYPGHVPLTRLEKAAMAVGSGVMSFLNPWRGDLIAIFGETTASPYFIERLRRAMLSSPTGRRILRDRPRITSESLNLPYLRTLPKNTVGGTYVAWLDREGVSPDTRTSVRYIDDEECAYVMQRYRESHDFYHALTGLPVVREGEVALKAFEFANTVLPMTGMSVFSVTTLKPAERKRFWRVYGPWALKNGLRGQEVINVYWEEEMETDVDELRRRLGIEQPPDLRDIRNREKEERRQRKLQQEQQQQQATVFLLVV
ncbi:coenzyme Q biosynthesis protein Coq4-domain-containing protein [Microdochium trichocladiopsis]|uniref:4-hydroxy-3-methoxy-5-polyprenylbenzoate decarboxylase n=1 Tax=Microdochium trichocladiopsis TaxID=1682393 RepID=A0A9P8YFN5_9PEZI|nr:coenzyme Q biosynthesis protein Coq4-domain-containing protein [Microdochium trichocladiopsis]KAH7037119.1 coenzyme Q biosynthesis protein Coq4-domain-containing protein [Microdochium trichocladiopsis]